MKLKLTFIMAIILIFSGLLIQGSFGDEGYSFLYAFGEKGTVEGQFMYPVGVALDSDSNVYVTDWNNDNIQKFSSSGTFLKRFGQDDKENWIRKPTGIAIHGKTVYVAEFGNHTIWKFSREGEFQGRFAQIGRGRGQLLYPRGIALDSAGNSYVADYRNGRIQKFSPAGEYIDQVMYKDRNTGKVFNPRGVHIDHNDNLYVTYTDENTVAKYDPGFKLLFLFGTKGSGPGEFLGPRYIAEDSDGTLYVSDYRNDRIMLFYHDGNFISSFGKSGSNALKRPEGMALDSMDNLYVADAENSRVTVFSPPGRVRHRNRARMYVAKAEMEQALKEYLSLRELDPLNKEATTFIVDLYTKKADGAFDEKNWDDAEHYYKLLLEYVPEDKINIEKRLEKIQFLRYLWMYVGTAAGGIIFLGLLLAVRRGAGRKRKNDQE